MENNPYFERVRDLTVRATESDLDAVVLFGQVNRRSLTDVDCDNGCLILKKTGGRRSRSFEMTFFTDFRYTPMVRRTASWLPTRDIWKGAEEGRALRTLLKGARRIGFEGSLSAARYLRLAASFKKAELIDIEDEILMLRAVKTPAEIIKLASAAALNDEIWGLARKEFRSGMTEKDIQRVIRAYMNALGDGEAFETIVCAGANAAECHHVPDDTPWHRGEPLLVDMGVKLDGFCSDMTRCLRARPSCAGAAEFNRIYDIVLTANRAAIAAAKPGMTAGALDEVARKIIREAGYGEAFGHSLGHGVGFEIHEAPTARPGDQTILKPGMSVTIEPGIYLEGQLGVRIEDLTVMTSSGCEVLSRSAK